MASYKTLGTKKRRLCSASGRQAGEDLTLLLAEEILVLILAKLTDEHDTESVLWVCKRWRRISESEVCWRRRCRALLGCPLRWPSFSSPAQVSSSSSSYLCPCYQQQQEKKTWKQHAAQWLFLENELREGTLTDLSKTQTKRYTKCKGETGHTVGLRMNPPYYGDVTLYNWNKYYMRAVYAAAGLGHTVVLEQILSVDNIGKLDVLPDSYGLPIILYGFLTTQPLQANTHLSRLREWLRNYANRHTEDMDEGDAIEHSKWLRVLQKVSPDCATLLLKKIPIWLTYTSLRKHRRPSFPLDAEQEVIRSMIRSKKEDGLEIVSRVRCPSINTFVEKGYVLAVDWLLKNSCSLQAPFEILGQEREKWKRLMSPSYAGYTQIFLYESCGLMPHLMQWRHVCKELLKTKSRAEVDRLQKETFLSLLLLIRGAYSLQWWAVILGQLLYAVTCVPNRSAEAVLRSKEMIRSTEEAKRVNWNFKYFMQQCDDKISTDYTEVHVLSKQ